LFSPIHIGEVPWDEAIQMITIRPDDTDNTTTPDGAANTDEHKKRIPLVWIPATLGVGLLIAVVYLGGRIVRARPSTSSEVTHVATSASAAPTIPPPPPPRAAKTAAEPEVQPAVEKGQPAPPAATEEAKPAAPAPKPAAAEPLTLVAPDDGVPMIAPKPGDIYIQVGALDHEATRRFVQHLRNENLDPHVAPGPKPELMRVLIGPFENRDALNEKKAQLEAEGMDTFVRQY
jgi:cell division septation protein DedD